MLDRDDIPFEDIRRNMKELDYINKNLGGHQITIRGFKAVLNSIAKGRQKKNGPISVCEIGCGGGDNLRVIKRYCERKGIAADFVGIDINPHCISFAGSRSENLGIRFIASDYRLVTFNEKPDIIFCSLFCHHFTDEGVVEILKWMKSNSGAGFFINDLHRNPLAYYSIKYLTKLFSKSYLVKNDACLSVSRGFKKKDWEMLVQRSSLSHIQIRWKWAFRWLLIGSNEATSSI